MPGPQVLSTLRCAIRPAVSLFLKTLRSKFSRSSNFITIYSLSLIGHGIHRPNGISERSTRAKTTAGVNAAGGICILISRLEAIQRMGFQGVLATCYCPGTALLY